MRPLMALGGPVLMALAVVGAAAVGVACLLLRVLDVAVGGSVRGSGRGVLSGSRGTV